ncbi:hypothetical protein DFJ58DRAFT_800048 [Suillus subalutaceus]|uniref:uncharacterized protein n=1 Tax=Suillus subalutaceus TaxID=48586 RepID=UPI001B87124B|nr:uncharacterized protein DFJ58DRAFT_800048 [Suillus subalutaceus]KAG1845872.1 hypothetical protein DFJ58DRAFT_800048 [Suillus subalutaceus]
MGKSERTGGGLLMADVLVTVVLRLSWTWRRRTSLVRVTTVGKQQQKPAARQVCTAIFNHHMDERSFNGWPV